MDYWVTQPIAESRTNSAANRVAGQKRMAGKIRATPKTLTPGSPVRERGLRFYQAELGRWVSRDPIGERGGLNCHGFVGNRPTFRVDRLGRAPYLDDPFPEPQPPSAGLWWSLSEFIIKSQPGWSLGAPLSGFDGGTAVANEFSIITGETEALSGFGLYATRMRRDCSGDCEKVVGGTRLEGVYWWRANTPTYNSPTLGQPIDAEKHEKYHMKIWNANFSLYLAVVNAVNPGQCVSPEVAQCQENWLYWARNVFYHKAFAEGTLFDIAEYPAVPGASLDNISDQDRSAARMAAQTYNLLIEIPPSCEGVSVPASCTSLSFLPR